MARNTTMPVFTETLYRILEDLEMKGLSAVASFLPHGRAFRVHIPNLFAAHVLPHWFKHQSWASFQRQLNRYGFTRITAGMDINAYYHVNFLRGQLGVARQIPRVTKKGRSPRKPDCPSKEPNFYSLPYLPATMFEVREPDRNLGPSHTSDFATALRRLIHSGSSQPTPFYKACSNATGASLDSCFTNLQQQPGNHVQRSTERSMNAAFLGLDHSFGGTTCVPNGGVRSDTPSHYYQPQCNRMPMALPVYQGLVRRSNEVHQEALAINYVAPVLAAGQPSTPSQSATLHNSSFDTL